MNSRRSQSLRSPILSATIAVLLSSKIAVFHSNAANTWDGGTGAFNTWNTAENWDNNIVPTSPAILTFAGTVNTSTSNDLTGFTANGITFTSSAGTFSLSGNSLTFGKSVDSGLSDGSVTGGIINNSANNQTISLPLTLNSGSHLITNTANGQLNLSGAVTRNANATVVFTQSGAGTIVGGGLSNDASGIIGGWAVFANDWATVNGGNVVAYAGYTDTTGNALADGATTNYRFMGGATSNLTANNITINSLLTQQTDANRTLTITNTLKITPNGGIYHTANSFSGTTNRTLTVTGGTLTANGGGEINLSSGALASATFGGGSGVNSVSNAFTVASTIANDSSPVSVNIVGYLILSGANTFSGGTFINLGRVQTGNAGAFGTGAVTVNPGSEVFFNTNSTFSNALNISGVGTTELSPTTGIAGPGALRLNQNALNLSGTITLQGDTRITSSNNSLPQITGQITGAGRLQVSNWDANAAGRILQLANTGSANNWVGDLMITAFGNIAGGVNVGQITLKLGAINQIPDTSSVTINGTDAATLDLNGQSETINGLISANSTNYKVTNSGGAVSVLHVGASGATATFGGVISNGTNSLSFDKVGTGTETLTGANTFTGATTVTAGKLLIGDGVSGSLSGTSSVTVSTGATLGGGGSITTAGGGGVNLNSGAFLAPGNSAGTLTLTLGSGQLDISGAVSLASSGAMQFELGTTSDKVVLSSGTLNIGSGVLEFDDFAFTNLAGFGAGTFTLFDSTTPIIGTLGANLTGTIAGLSASVQLADGGNDVLLVVVPEPSTIMALLGGSFLLATLRRTRRS